MNGSSVTSSSATIDKMGVENAGSFPECIRATSSQSELPQTTTHQAGSSNRIQNGHRLERSQSTQVAPKTRSNKVLRAQATVDLSTHDHRQKASGNLSPHDPLTLTHERRQRKPALRSSENIIESVPATQTSSRHSNREAKLESLEQSHVHDVYEKTAHHFEDVRLKAWPKVKQFLLDLEPGSIVADIGCGHGKYLHINKDIFSLGSDRSTQLINIAHKHNHEVMVCDGQRLPYRSGTFDAVISIGVLHHFTSAGRRAAGMKEMARLLRPGGKLMCYVWAMEQRTRKFKSQDVLVPWHLHLRPHNKGSKKVQQGDLSDPESEEPIRSHKSRSHHRKSDAWQNARTLNVSESSDVINPKSPTEKIDSPSFPALLKLRLLNLFGSGDEEKDVQSGGKESSTLSPLQENKPDSMTVRQEYQRLFEEVLQQDIANFQRHKPVLEHSVSAPEVDGAFAVREFPQSSQPRSSALLDQQPRSTVLSRQCAVDRHSNISHQPSSTLPFSPSSISLPIEADQSDSEQARSLRLKADSCSTLDAASSKPCINKNTLASQLKPVGNMSTPNLSSQSPPPVQFRVGGGTSLCEGAEGGDNWMHATTQAIKTVESQVERISAAHRKFNLRGNRQNGQLSKHSKSSAEMTILSRNGNVQILNGRASSQSNGKNGIDNADTCSSLPVHRGRFPSSSRGSSISSLSSDNGSETENEDLASFFSTDSELLKETNDAADVTNGDADDDDVFIEKTTANVKQPSISSRNNTETKNVVKELKEKEVCREKFPPSSHCLKEQEDKHRKEQEDKEQYKRFYHVFKEGELTEMIQKNVESLHVINSYYDHANWCVVAEKIQVWNL